MRSQMPGEQRHVVLDHEDRRAGDVLHPLQERAERLGLLLGDAAGRLVEHDHRRVRREQAGQLDDAAGAGRQLAGELLAERVEAHELDEEVDLLVDVGLALLRRPAGRGRRRRCPVLSRWRSRATARVSAVVSAGKSRASWNERPRPRAARWCGGRSVMSSPCEEDAALVDREEAGDAVEQRGLAGAVLADEPEDLALPELEVDVVRRR